MANFMFKASNKVAPTFDSMFVQFYHIWNDRNLFNALGFPTTTNYAHDSIDNAYHLKFDNGFLQV